MFLIGLIAGVVVTFVTGSTSMMIGGGTQIPTAPTGTNPPPVAAAPQANVQDRMVAYAAEIGLDKAKFTACLAENKFTEKINKQMAEGQAAGVNGTPGNIIYDLKSKTGIVVSGAQPIDNFKKAIDAMMNDPKTAATVAGATAAGPVVPVDLNADHVRGSKTAQIALIEYSDYECPFCHRVHPTITQLMKDYDGKIMWIYRHFPLSFHPQAMPLANGAECANELGGSDAYWKFTDKVMGE